MELIVILVLGLFLAIPAAVGWVFAAFVLRNIRRELGQVDIVVAFSAVCATAVAVLAFVEIILGGWPLPRPFWLPAVLSSTAGTAVLLWVVGTSSSASSRDGLVRPVVAGMLASVAMAWVLLMTTLLTNPPGV